MVVDIKAIQKSPGACVRTFLLPASCILFIAFILTQGYFAVPLNAFLDLASFYQLEDPVPNPLKRIVVAAHYEEDVAWLDGVSRHWQVTIMGPGGLPANKGHEAMAYLTYIIQNYINLPESMAFIHSHESSWHSPRSQLETLLKIPCWEKLAYASITSTGVPVELYLNSTLKGAPLSEQEEYTSDAWKMDPNFELLLAMDMPGVIKTPCCASFIVNRERILKRPKHVYEALRQWLIDTNLDDASSGRVMEYTWHILFGEPAVTQALDLEQTFCNDEDQSLA